MYTHVDGTEEHGEWENGFPRALPAHGRARAPSVVKGAGNDEPAEQARRAEAAAKPEAELTAPCLDRRRIARAGSRWEEEQEEQEEEEVSRRWRRAATAGSAPVAAAPARNVTFSTVVSLASL